MYTCSWRYSGWRLLGCCVCVYTVVCVVLLSKCQVLRKLICDSRSSDSFAERSTVDYIVPGEMELMSAVRYYNSVL